MASPLEVVLFSNLNSGKNKNDEKEKGLPRRIRKFMKIIGNNGQVFMSGQNGDYRDELAEYMGQVCQHRPDVIITDGGDATCLGILSAFYSAKPDDYNPLFGALPSGTFNILPKKRLKVKKANKYLENIVRTSKEDSEERFTKDAVHMMKVNDGQNEHLSFSVGVGLPVALLEEAYKKKRWKYARVAMVGMRTIVSAAFGGKYYQRFNKKEPLTIAYTNNQGEQKTFEDREWLGFMAQSINTLGLWKRIDKLFWKAEKSPDMFHAIATDKNLTNVMTFLVPLLTGRNPSYEDWESGEQVKVTPLSHQVKNVRITGPEFKWQYNGELSYGPDPCVTDNLYISNGPVIEFIDNFFK